MQLHTPLDHLEQLLVTTEACERLGLFAEHGQTPPLQAQRGDERSGGFVKAGLVDQDAALDACAPKGAAIEVTWGYISSAAQNVSVVATSGSQAECITKAMGGVRAGIDASCSAVLLLGDLTAITAAYDARK